MNHAPNLRQEISDCDDGSLSNEKPGALHSVVKAIAAGIAVLLGVGLLGVGKAQAASGFF